MKKLFLLLSVLILVGCEKETIQPAPTPKPNEPLYIYRAYGFKHLDTSAIYVNGNKFISDSVMFDDLPIPGYKQYNGYNVRFNPGDTFAFYYSGIVNFYYDNKIKTPQSICDFAIWENENKQPSESMKTFLPIRSTQYVGNDTIFRASISGSLIIQ